MKGRARTVEALKGWKDWRVLDFRFGRRAPAPRTEAEAMALAMERLRRAIEANLAELERQARP